VTLCVSHLRMNNTEIQQHCTEDTERRQTKKNTQKTKLMINTNVIKKKLNVNQSDCKG
jgi:hypothetical protein